MFNQYLDYGVDIPSTLKNVKDVGLKLPYHKNPNKTRVLFIFDSAHISDYSKKKFLSGIMSAFLPTVDNESKKKIGESILSNHEIFTINLRCITSDSKAESSNTDSDDDASNDDTTIENIQNNRVLSFFKKVKPQKVVTFGAKSYKLFSQFFVEKSLSGGSWTNYLGVPLEIEVNQLPSTLIPMLNPVWLCVYQDSRDPYLIGFFIKRWCNVVTGQLRYNMQLTPEDIKIHYVDSIKKFDKMVDHLMTQKIVAIDTETENLNRVANRIVIIQFSYSKKSSFVLPLYHYQTPFTKDELEYICNRLRDFFIDNENEFHLYANGNFDLPLLRKTFNFPYYKNPIWDVQAGEFALDENLFEISSVTGTGYYGLGNLCAQYGFFGYITGKFGKEDRAGISNQPLDTPGLIDYCAFDTAVLIGIYQQQIRQAADEKHAKYENVVKYLIGDTIHTFSTMNVNGVLVDKKHLWWLSSAESPINEVVEKMESEILTSDAVKSAEKLIRSDNKVPTTGLFGTVTSKIFNLRKKQHLKTLFFDVLKLPPINVGADGPALDKTFQDEYAENPLVAAYTGLVKAKKIRDAFVKSLIKTVSNDEDAKVDSRIRPNFNYLRVVTGRTSANAPNLQQIPARGALSKYIKRVFVARPGTIFIKVDFSAHEVRGWSLISGDKAVASAFQRGIDLEKAFVNEPTPENLKKLKEEGDIHIINSSYFFGIPVSEVTPDIRQSVKGVTFGLIYGRSANSLSKQLNKPLSEVNDVIDKFFKRFKVASNWLLDVEKFARKNYYVEAPTGLRRHLWPYLLPNTKDKEKQWNSVAAACDRRARNSPIQGMGSGIGYSAARYLETWTYERFKDYALKYNQLPIRNQNMVHDSTEVEVDYSHIIYGTEMVKESLTKGVESKCVKLFGMNFPVGLAIDMEIGPTMDTVKKWDGTIQSLHDILEFTFTYQKETLGYDVDVKKEMKKVFTGYMSKQLQTQIDKGYFKSQDLYTKKGKK